LRRGGSWLAARAGAVGAPLARPFDAALARLLATYPVVLERALGRPRLVLGAATLLFAAAVVGAATLSVDLVPSLAQGEFSYLVELPEGTPLAVTDRMLLPAQQSLREDPRIRSFSAVVGGAGLSATATGSEGENFGRIDVRLKAGTTGRAEEETIGRLREELARIPRARLTFQRPALFSFRTPIEVEVYGDDLRALGAAASALRERMAAVAGLVDVRSSAELGNPELQVRFDREALARLGLRLDEVAATLRQKVRGDVATRFNEGDRDVDVVVRSSGEEVSAAELAGAIVDQRQGTPIHLASVARVEKDMGPSEIRRIAQRRAAVVSANLAHRSLGDAAAEVGALLREQALPPGVVASLSGQEEERRRSFQSLLLALALSLFLVYLVMAAEFESLLHPFIIFFTVPLGAIGVVAALLLTGQSVNVVVMIGIIMLGGIVVDNAIVLIDAVNQLRSEGHPRRQALVLGGRRRLRPILMTSATTALGLLPMALGFGEGAELRQPLAVTVIGGMAVSTVLTLVVIPVIYLVLDRKADPVRVPAEAPAGAVPV
jgi:HAE1 family hydrophobic/amphiphilic exporter-1